jgi:threonine aldolase
MVAGGRVIDLRSDTVTRPTPAMREAIAAAEVGDDQFGDDPTVRRLEERVAALLGKERSLFFPTGIMANQTALLLHGRPGTEVVVEADSHLIQWEEAGAAAWGGLQLRAVPTPDGILSAERARAAIRPDSPYQPRTSLIAVENTHNGAGGRVVPLHVLRDIRRLADDHGLPVHMDGARLWNASIASGTTPADFAASADTVMVALSKGLGCPAGSMLAGSADAMQAAWRIRRRMGGAMRQSGILAAAGLHALDYHVQRLADDHRRARRLAELAAHLPGVAAVPPDTNIVMLDLLRDDLDAATLVARLAARGVLLVAYAPRKVRAVTHLDIDDDHIQAAADALDAVLSSLQPEGDTR